MTFFYLICGESNNLFLYRHSAWYIYTYVQLVVVRRSIIFKKLRIKTLYINTTYCCAEAHETLYFLKIRIKYLYNPAISCDFIMERLPRKYVLVDTKKNPKWKTYLNNRIKMVNNYLIMYNYPKYVIKLTLETVYNFEMLNVKEAAFRRKMNLDQKFKRHYVRVEESMVHIYYNSNLKPKCTNCLKQVTTRHACYRCSKCNILFKTKKTYDRHKCVSTFYYQCDVCNKNFTREDNLLRHKKIHDADKIYHSCDKCTYKTTRKYDLKRHANKKHS